MNKGKQLVIALAVLAVLVLISLQMRRDPFEKSGRKDYSSLFPKRTEGSIDKIVVKNKEVALSAEKRGDTWWIVEPSELSADENVLKTAASFLEKVSVSDIASKKKERQAEYGLAAESPDKVEVKAFSKGSQLLDFTAGKVTADFKGSFILLASHPGTVYSTNEALPFLFNRGVKDWRNKFIVDLPKEEIERIKLQNANGALELEKDGQGDWARKDDPQWKVDSTRLNQMLATFCKLSWADVLDNPDPAADYGFKNAQAVLSLGAKGKEYVITVGKDLDQPKGNTFVQVEGDPKVYQVRKAQVEKIMNDWNYFRDNQPAAGQEPNPAPANAEKK